MNTAAGTRRREDREIVSATSDIHELRREAVVVDMATARPAAVETCALLATVALEHAARSEHALARNATADALALVESLAGSDQHAERACAARARTTLGEAFLLLHEAHRAKTSFARAMDFFDRERDQARAADARVGLAKALLALHDPTARAVLEDAGELFEELGDEHAARAVDFALRQAEASFDESPRSFHASGARA